MQLAVADVNERWNRAAQVQQCMKLDGRLGGSNVSLRASPFFSGSRVGD
jgi:hypothetical protein